MGWEFDFSVLDHGLAFTAAKTNVSVLGRDEKIDVLRGLAVLGVLLVHAQNAWYLGAGSDWPIEDRLRIRDHWLGMLSTPATFGFLGLNLFFLLSGFCIHLGTLGWEQDSSRWKFSYKAFIKRRLVRLYPAYVGAIVFSLLCLVFSEWIRLHILGFEALSQFAANTAEQTIRYLTFTHTLKNETFGGYNPPLYTMAIEFHFYLLYPVVLWAIRRWGSVWTFGAATAFSAGWIVAVLCFDQEEFSRLVMDSVLVRWPEWILGCVMAEQWSRFRSTGTRMSLRPDWGVALGALFLSMGGYVQIVHRVQINILWTVGLYCLAVWYLVYGKRPEGVFKGLVCRIGLISYSVYLLHYPILRLCAILMPPEPPQLLANLGVYGVVIPSILLLGFWFFKVFEEPFLSRRSAQPAFINP